MVCISLWQQTLDVNDAFQQLIDEGLGSGKLLRELGKGLLIKKSLQEFKIAEPAKEESDSLLAQFKASMKLSSDEAFEKWLEKNQLTIDKLQKNLSKQHQVNTLIQTVIPETQVKEAFLKRKAQLDQVIFSILRISDSRKAQEIYAQLKAEPHRFLELAKAHSEGPEKEQGGLIGPRPFLSLNPELRSKLSTLKPGEITAPFSLDDKQYLMIKLDQVISPKLTPQLASQIQNELFEAWVSRQLQLAGFHLVETQELINANA